MAYKNLAEALQSMGYEGALNQEDIEKSIYEISKNKTRVVISGAEKRNEITSAILHVLEFHGIETDFITGENYNEAYVSTENDFIIINGNPSNTLHNLHANIALITSISESENTEDYRQFIKNITSGGALIFNDENSLLQNLAENSENYFRKFPYQKPNLENQNNTISIETEIGSIPLQTIDYELVNHLEGAKYICQQLGILEEDFYEAMMSF